MSKKDECFLALKEFWHASPWIIGGIALLLAGVGIGGLADPELELTRIAFGLSVLVWESSVALLVVVERKRIAAWAEERIELLGAAAYRVRPQVQALRASLARVVVTVIPLISP